MSKAKFIQENGETILPITHEEVVLDNNGKNLPSKYQQKQDENLLTESKTIVGAINELSTKGNEGTITSVPYTEGSDLDIEQIGGGGSSVGEVTSDDVKIAYNDKNLTEELNVCSQWIQSNQDWLQEVNDVAYANQGKIGESELATNDKTLTGAINELFQNVDNGKNLIATSIGEPLSAEDTFQAMSNDIDGLLSTFKTNMMKNGITVESNDKFKSLIDKVATITESDNKGLQFAMGTITLASATSTIDVSNLKFTPDVILIQYTSGNYLYTLTYNSFVHTTNYYQFAHTSSGDSFYTRSVSTTYYINSTGFKLANTVFPTNVNLTWIAIGVGEEDTTLRDSLASILQDSGVEVTEGDDMASLISKVDQKLDNSRGLDIITATELPSTGKEGQLCILTEMPANSFLISNDPSNPPSDGILLITSTSSDFPISVTTGNLTTEYLFDSIHQNGQFLESYFYTNNQWNKVTKGLEVIFIMNSGVFNNTTVFGGLTSGTQFQYSSSERGLILYKPSNWWATGTFANRIDFSSYKTLTLTAYCASNMEGSEFYVGVFETQHNAGTYSYKQAASAITQSVVLPTTPKEYTFDISSWDCSGYLGFAQNSYYNVVITNLTLSKE